ncbi:MAG: Na+/H+ antiporter subunit E [bacterium]
MRRVFPVPVLSALMLTNWLLIQGSLAPGDILVGAILATLLPLATSRFWPDSPHLHRIDLLVRYIAVFLWDVVVANLQVAWWIIGPQSKLHPRFIHIPLELEHPFSITVFASTISLTPGTVSSHISGDRKLLIVHCLNAPDEQAMINAIKEHTKSLKEILE